MTKDKYRIIVVDDDANTAELLAMTIQTLTEYSVRFFNDPHQALNHFMKESADLVITDISMPGIDGFEMVQKMK
ncbi:MAG: response regulator, partial [Desulfobacterales bacterium]|nr:response regulator [Desulfobacterales bacterium]